MPSRCAEGLCLTYVLLCAIREEFKFEDGRCHHCVLKNDIWLRIAMGQLETLWSWEMPLFEDCVWLLIAICQFEGDWSFKMERCHLCVLTSFWLRIAMYLERRLSMKWEMPLLRAEELCLTVVLLCAKLILFIEVGRHYCVLKNYVWSPWIRQVETYYWRICCGAQAIMDWYWDASLVVLACKPYVVMCLRPTSGRHFYWYIGLEFP